VIGLCLGCLASCGYSSGVRLPQGAESVGVSVFDNLSPLPEIERELFACLSTQASRMIDGELVAPSRADVIVRGEIVDYRRLYGVLNREGMLQQSSVRIVLRAWLEDRETGERMGDTIQVDQAIRYVIRARQEEAGARDQALAQLCQELVLDLFNQPDYRMAPPPEDLEAEQESLDDLELQPLDIDLDPATVDT
jgi:hypothetical protein